MVLESLVSPFKAEKHPAHMAFLGFLYSSVAIFISLQIFDEMAGLVAVFLTVMAAIPLMYSTMKYEEEKDLEDFSEVKLLREHSKAISFLTFLFIGMTLSFTLFFIFMSETTAHNFFSLQINTIKSINSPATGQAVSSDMSFFLKIFLNNLRVLMFCILFAFFYGAGAIFILTWNASVIAVAIGTFFRNNISEYAEFLGFHAAAQYFHIFSLSLMRYFLHGIPEIMAYFTGGLAGGIISIALIKKDFRSQRFERVLIDIADLVIIAVALLVVAGLIEVFITPAFFS